MSRASYARARRSGGTQAESKLRPALEKVKAGAVAGVKAYLKGTNALAEKLRPALEKLPKVKSGRTHRRPMQKK